jgi:MFS family permease
VARLIALAAASTAIGWYVLFGWLSDRVGRKKPIVAGYVLALLLLFPLFHFIADQANPARTDSMARYPVVVTGSGCSYNPFASHGQITACGKLSADHSRAGRGLCDGRSCRRSVGGVAAA